MDLTGDELAGVVDLFGALSREELGQALVELAFKRGEDREPSAFDAEIDDALDTYHLVAVERTDPDEDWLFPGPVAFPELVEDATDLPHIMDVEQRSIDRERLGEAAEVQFRRDTTEAVEAGDADRIEQLLDVSYELEVWAPVEVAEERDRLDNVLS
ncbi:DUF7109 family protein [Halorientalis salina]|uniref:DUF7109 family protein n=1 Tax=Halorientalis salina TaxID=2932266 RepID=UPI0010AD25E6|nr:hypothetical protein [Halorientalis salina]